MNGGTNDWRELREFIGVDLTRSFVLSWELVSGALKIDVDVCLLPNHAFYEEPRPAEGLCIRPAMLEFPYCTSLSAVKDDDASRDAAQTAAALGNGKIEGLRRIGDGHYEFTGAFGRVKIRAERPLLRLKEPMV